MKSFQIDLTYVWVELFSKSFVHYYLQKKTNNWGLWVAFGLSKIFVVMRCIDLFPKVFLS